MAADQSVARSSVVGIGPDVLAHSGSPIIEIWPPLHHCIPHLLQLGEPVGSGGVHQILVLKTKLDHPVRDDSALICVSKFALTGFSEGLRSGLLKDNIYFYVTTVCPGLMRTGSPRNALFKGDNEAEYAWFATSDALPGLSMNADRAARRIVNACIRGEAEVVLSLPAKIAVKVDAFMPGITADILALVNSLLPSAERDAKQAKTGKASSSDAPPRWVTALNDRAAESNNQIA